MIKLFREPGNTGADRRLVLAHYMPWYEANPARRQWGWHWTMNHFQPDHQTGERRDAASQYYPLIGLYDSNDPDTLECHVLLMKFAGIDGVIIDWYGKDDLYDYAQVHRNTEHLIRQVKKAGLRFAIMYEEQTVPKLRDAHRLPGDDVVAHGQRLLQWMQENWFRDPAYVRQNGRPVFTVFGGGFYTEAQWNQIFAPLAEPKPALYTELGLRAPAVGAFGWVVPDKGTEAGLKEIEGFYSRSRVWPEVIAGAFPRFHDIYAEAGVHPSWGRIEDRNGKTYTTTLEQAFASRANIIQLITWNDWGEGTVIEPSVEFGYRDLEATQRLRRQHIQPPLPYTAADLRLPVALYRLRKKYPGAGKEKAALETVARLLFAGRTGEARTLLKKQFGSLLEPAGR